MMELGYLRTTQRRRASRILCVTVAGLLLSLLVTINTKAEETTKPNEGISVTYDNPILEQIKQHNSELAYELNILPEIKEKNLDKDKGLENILNLLSNPTYEPKLNDNINYFIENIGIKDKRAYSTPIEAIYWLAEKNDPGLSNIILKGSLNSLLKLSWGTCKGPEWQTWEGQVKDRLNSPELLEYFTNNFLRYATEYQGDGKNHHQLPQETLDLRKGDCEDFAMFILDGLANGGYNTKIIMRSVGDPVTKKFKIGHVFCVYENPKTKKFHFLQGYDDNEWNVQGRISQPFDNEENIANYFMDIMKGVVREESEFYSVSEFKKGKSDVERGYTIWKK